jgi:hypothetical protein
MLHPGQRLNLQTLYLKGFCVFTYEFDQVSEEVPVLSKNSQTQLEFDNFRDFNNKILNFDNPTQICILKTEREESREESELFKFL